MVPTRTNSADTSRAVFSSFFSAFRMFNHSISLFLSSGSVGSDESFAVLVSVDHFDERSCRRCRAGARADGRLRAEFGSKNSGRIATQLDTAKPLASMSRKSLSLFVEPLPHQKLDDAEATGSCPARAPQQLTHTPNKQLGSRRRRGIS